MAFFPKILGQTRPAAATLTDNYTVPAATKTTVTTILIHNTSTTTTDVALVTFAPLGAADATIHQSYNLDVPLNGTWNLTIGATLATTDKVRVKSTNGTINFTTFGIEET
jgi:hypothetical protein